MFDRKTVLGITGGIGSGKSEVLRILADRPDTQLMEADRLAKELMLPGEPIYKEVVEAFGEEILEEDGSISKVRLGDIVFHDPEQLEKLNSIVHPGVKRYILEDIERCEKRFYIIEAALLIQDGYKEICDEIWYIHVPTEIRIERLLSSRGGTREKWEAVIRNQPEDEYFLTNADRVIENDGTPEVLKERVLEALLRGANS
jgi:dephospho-CoA kinase